MWETCPRDPSLAMLSSHPAKQSEYVSPLLVIDLLIRPRAHNVQEDLDKARLNTPRRPPTSGRVRAIMTCPGLWSHFVESLTYANQMPIISPPTVSKQGEPIPWRGGA